MNADELIVALQLLTPEQRRLPVRYYEAPNDMGGLSDVEHVSVCEGLGAAGGYVMLSENPE